eukprot:TRINITY_DN2892_c0_g1_i1.p1 TRINITY_DN2892_c0_g1~~TRINITY_DN2892_c0_g1_i1.p1  ORF type:complete len:584 (-),score=96.14 TRINITY_DN2892_c0_g1_i1:1497-3248(-)
MGALISRGICQPRVGPKHTDVLSDEDDVVQKVTVVSVEGDAVREDSHIITPHAAQNETETESITLASLPTNRDLDKKTTSSPSNAKKASVTSEGSFQSQRASQDSNTDSKRSLSVGIASPSLSSKGRFSLSFRGPKINRADYADQMSAKFHDKLVEDPLYMQSEFPRFITSEVNAQVRIPFSCGDYHGLTFSGYRLGDKTCCMLLESANIPEFAPHVSCLCLRNNNLSSKSMTQVYHILQNFTHLNKLDLSCNPIGDVGVQLILDLFSKSGSLVSINLSHVGATDECIPYLIVFLNAQHNIQELRLSSNHFSVESIEKLIEAMGSNKLIYQLDLEGSPGYTDKHHKQLDAILNKNSSSKGKNPPIEWECHPEKESVCIGTVVLPDGSFPLSTQTSKYVVQDICIIDKEGWVRTPLYPEPDLIVSEQQAPRSLSFISYTNEVIAALGEIGLKQKTLVNGTYTFGYSETIGRRLHMEDRVIIHDNFLGQPGWCLLGLFDGHGGTDAAIFASEQVPNMLTILYSRNGFDMDPAMALHQSFVEVNEAMSGFLFCGTTALVALIIGDTLYMACAGDSRAVICRGGNKD